MKKKLLSLACLLLLIGFDQWTKYFVAANLSQTPMVLWEGVFEFHYSINRGAAFGILQNHQMIFKVLTMLVLVFLVVVWGRMQRNARFAPVQRVLVLLAAGACGNLIDRIRQGYVVDFLYFRLIDFPVFNVADSYVVISVFLLLFLLLFRYREEDFKELLP